MDKLPYNQKEQYIERFTEQGKINDDHNPYVPCPQHQQFEIINYCQDQDCQEPLCQECINNHQQMHLQDQTNPNIVPIEQKRIECKQIINNLKIELISKKDQLLKEKNIGIISFQEKILNYKRKVQEVIETYFNYILQEACKQIGEKENNNQNNIDEEIIKLSNIIEELEKQQQDLSNENYVRVILQQNSQEFQQEMNQLINEINHKDNVGNNIIQNDLELIVDESKLYTINIELSKYLFVGSQEQNLQRKQADQSRINKTQNQNYVDQEDQRRPLSTKKSQDLSVKDQEILATDRQSQNISIPDYFETTCLRKFLHYFQDNSKRFHYLDLDTVTKDPETQKWQQKDLSIQFRIPMFHRSIITPSGAIYLTGGLSVEKKKEVLNSVFQLNYAQNTLDVLTSMNKARNSHGICYAKDFIFVMGGNSNESSINYCEKYDIRKNKWIQIANLPKKCTGCCLANYNNKFIYKFGGKIDTYTLSNTIDQYDIQLDSWQTIKIQLKNPDDTLKLPSFSSACQINNNDILILGGQFYELKVNQTIILRVKEIFEGQQEFTIINSQDLIQQGTFWTNPIICGNVLFATQNVTLDTQPVLEYFNKKSILAFNGIRWKELLQ